MTTADMNTARRIDMMNLSERARLYVAGTDINSYNQMFGSCTASDIEQMAVYKVYGIGEVLPDEFDDYESARDLADKMQEDSRKKFFVVDGFGNFLD